MTFNFYIEIVYLYKHMTATQLFMEAIKYTTEVKQSHNYVSKIKVQSITVISTNLDEHPDLSKSYHDI